MEIIFDSIWNFIGTIILIVTCGYALSIPFHFSLTLLESIKKNRDESSLSKKLFK
jgi:hypothetical protein